MAISTININYAGSNTTFTSSAPVQQITILDSTNPVFLRNAFVTDKSVILKRGGSVVTIPLSQLFGAAATADPTMTWKPIITTQPTVNNTITHPATGSFTISASAETSLTYSWYYHTSGSVTWTSLPASSGSNTATIKMLCPLATPLNNSSYICYVNNTTGNVTSSVGTLYIL